MDYKKVYEKMMKLKTAAQNRIDVFKDNIKAEIPEALRIEAKWKGYQEAIGDVVLILSEYEHEPTVQEIAEATIGMFDTTIAQEKANNNDSVVKGLELAKVIVHTLCEDTSTKIATVDDIDTAGIFDSSVKESKQYTEFQNLLSSLFVNNESQN